MLPMDWIDIAIFLGTLGFVLVVGMWAGREEEDAEEEEALEESVLSELENSETELERQLITEGQSVENWEELRNVKFALSLPLDALTCLFEGLWLEENGEREAETIREALIPLLAEQTASETLPSSRNNEPAHRIRSLLMSLIYSGRSCTQSKFATKPIRRR